jgi:hypothetical protein
MADSDDGFRIPALTTSFQILSSHSTLLHMSVSLYAKGMSCEVYYISNSPPAVFQEELDGQPYNPLLQFTK